MEVKRVKVWLRSTTPQPSWTAFKHHTAGRLWLFEDRAEFRPRSGETLALTPVLKVARGWKNSEDGEWILPIADTWVEVQFGEATDIQVVYLNDARWFGWGSLLLRSRSILTA